MVRTRSLFTALLAAAISVPAVSAGKVQKDGLALPAQASASRDAVRGIFMKSFEAYTWVFARI